MTCATSTPGAPASERAPLPAEPATVGLYVTHLARTRSAASTIQRRLAAISQVHQLAGHVPPPTADWEVRQVVQGIRRSLGTAPAQKEAVLTATLRRLVASCDPKTCSAPATGPSSCSASGPRSAAASWSPWTSRTSP